jgi:hypothetical protein
MISNVLSKLRTNLFGSGPQRAGSGVSGLTKTDNISLTKSPISSLDSNPLSFGTYQFPKDVFENQQLGHYMVFYVNVTDKSKYDYSKKNFESNPLDEFGVDGNVYAGVKRLKYGHVGTKAHANRLKVASNKAKGTNSGSGEPNLATSNRNSNALQGFSSTYKTTSRITDSIALYLPPNVQETTSARYEDTPTGILGTTATGIVAGLNAFQLRDFEKTGKIAYGMVSDVAQEILKNLGGGLIEGLTNTEGVVPLANKVFGRAENPFVEVFFSSMNLRTFTYNFNFAPRNRDETAEIQQIIQLFRFHMAPEMQETNNRYLTLPSEFDIHYMYKAENGNGYENDFYGRIGTCVLESVVTNYTPGKVASFSDGAPTQITMSLTFKETEALTKEKINEGY